jgi:uncharacterized protein
LPIPDHPSCRLAIQVQPRASRSEIAGAHGDAIKVRLAAPPVDGAANEALIRLLAEALDLPRGAIRLVSGQGGRRKVIAIDGLDAASARARLTSLGRG